MAENQLDEVTVPTDLEPWDLESSLSWLEQIPNNELARYFPKIPKYVVLLKIMSGPPVIKTSYDTHP